MMVYPSFSASNLETVPFPLQAFHPRVIIMIGVIENKNLILKFSL
nr:MAG TPA: hypothetical protein [Caudoviricetes sp.]